MVWVRERTVMGLSSMMATFVSIVFIPLISILAQDNVSGRRNARIIFLYYIKFRARCQRGRYIEISHFIH